MYSYKINFKVDVKTLSIRCDNLIYILINKAFIIEFFKLNQITLFLMFMQ